MLAEILLLHALQEPEPPPGPPPAAARRAQAEARAAARARQRELEKAQRVLMAVYQEDRMPDLARDELLGRLHAFDRDGDACATLAEFRAAAAWSPLRSRREAEAIGVEDAWAALLRCADGDGDGVLAHEEALAFFDARDLDGDGVLSRSERADGPRVGEKAPDFSLPAPGGEELSSLSALLKDGKPVALLFGSYT